MINNLWADLNTDLERVEYLRTGQAWKAGIIAAAIVEDVAAAFEFRAKHTSQPIVEADADIACSTCFIDKSTGFNYCSHCGRKLHAGTHC